MSRLKTNWKNLSVVAAVIATGIVVVGGLILGAAWGIPVLINTMSAQQWSESLPDLADDFDNVTEEFPAETQVSGSFVGSGSVLLTGEDGSEPRTVDLSLTNTTNKVAFDGILSHYTITVTNVDTNDVLAIYDSKEHKVIQK